jgi:hypothetical protein
MKTKTSYFESFIQAESEQELRQIQLQVQQGGYSAFYGFLDSFTEEIKQFRDEDAEAMMKLLDKAKQWFPTPSAFSPSWEKVWGELEKTIVCKTKVLNAIPLQDRDGEWQILIDNPYEIRDVTCYPGLSFDKAAYLYGYFHPQLEKNEYVRLQKIETAIMDFGA